MYVPVSIRPFVAAAQAFRPLSPSEHATPWKHRCDAIDRNTAAMPSEHAAARTDLLRRNDDAHVDVDQTLL